jgi:hypothetical protein
MSFSINIDAHLKHVQFDKWIEVPLLTQSADRSYELLTSYYVRLSGRIIALQSVAFLLFLSWFSCLVSTSTLITLFSVLSFINLGLWDSIYYIFSYVLRLAIERMWLMQQGTGRYFWLGRRNWMLLYTDKSDTNTPEINNIYTCTLQFISFLTLDDVLSLSFFFRSV